MANEAKALTIEHADRSIKYMTDFLSTEFRWYLSEETVKEMEEALLDRMKQRARLCQT